MGAVLSFTQHLEALTCWVCGIDFAISSTYKRSLERAGEDAPTLFCPRGCRLGHGKSKAARLRENLDAMQRSRDQARDDARVARIERDHQERRASTYKGHLTKTKNKLEKTQIRVKHGVCPCCNRTFKQLQAHMKRKHPNYAAEVEEVRQVLARDGGE